jgi:hypothetical protein
MEVTGGHLDQTETARTMDACRMPGSMELAGRVRTARVASLGSRHRGRRIISSCHSPRATGRGRVQHGDPRTVGAAPRVVKDTTTSQLRQPQADERGQMLASEPETGRQA